MTRHGNHKRYQLNLRDVSDASEVTRDLGSVDITYIDECTSFTGYAGELLVVCLRLVDHDLEKAKTLWSQRVMLNPSARRDEMKTTNTFTLTEDHIKLLRAAWVEWHDTAPGIDQKRPYGNQDVMLDVAEELGWDIFSDVDDEQHLSPEQYERAKQIHRETDYALQIVLQHGSFEPGEYQIDPTRPYSGKWIRVT